MIAASWTAWLLGASGPGVSFDNFLQSYGLKEKPPPLTPEERRQMAQKNYLKAFAALERME